MTDKILIDRFVVEQALKLLDALSCDENYDYDGCFQHWTDYARPEKLALQFRAALEQDHCEHHLNMVQPQVKQEPVAWLHADGKHQPLYTHPQHKREPLTDEQVMQAVRHLYQSDVAAGMGFPDDLYVARAIEAAHGIGESNA